MVNLQRDADAIKIVGTISFANVNQLDQDGKKLIDEVDQLTFDFSAVEHSDSSGLTLITSWMRYAKQKQKNVSVINLPQQLREVAAACRLDQVFPQWIN